jgi:hypothetical protein
VTMGVDEEGKHREPNPFIDPEAYRAFIAKAERAYLDQLEGRRAKRQRANKGAESRTR